MNAPRQDEQRAPGVIATRLAELAPAAGFTLWSDAPSHEPILDLLDRTAQRLRTSISAAPVKGGLRIQRAAATPSPEPRSAA